MASLSLSPDTVVPGSNFQLSSSGWEPKEAIDYVWTNSKGQEVYRDVLKAFVNGEWNAVIWVSKDREVDTYTIRMSSVTNPFNMSQVKLQVVPGTHDPPVVFVSPEVIAQGGTLTLGFAGFQANEDIDGSIIDSDPEDNVNQTFKLKALGDGSGSGKVVIDSRTPTGNAYILLKGRSSNRSAQRQFTVTSAPKPEPGERSVAILTPVSQETIHGGTPIELSAKLTLEDGSPASGWKAYVALIKKGFLGIEETLHDENGVAADSDGIVRYSFPAVQAEEDFDAIIKVNFGDQNTSDQVNFTIAKVVQKLTIDKLPEAFAGQKFTATGTFFVGGEPGKDYEARVQIFRKNALGFWETPALFDNEAAGVPVIVDSKGKWSATFDFPRDLQFGNLTDVDMRLDVAISTQKASTEFKVRPRPIRAVIKNPHTEPEELAGTEGERFELVAEIASSGDGAPSHVWAALFYRDSEDMLEGSKVVSQQPIGGFGNLTSMEYRVDLQVEEDIPKGGKIEYDLVAGVYDIKTGQIITIDQTVHIRIIPGSGISAWWARNGTKVIVAGSVAAAGGIGLAIVTNRAGPLSKIYKLAELNMAQKLASKS